MRDQSHGVSEPGVSGQCWHIVERFPVEVPIAQIDVPRYRGPNKKWPPDP